MNIHCGNGYTWVVLALIFYAQINIIQGYGFIKQNITHQCKRSFLRNGETFRIKPYILHQQSDLSE